MGAPVDEPANHAVTTKSSIVAAMFGKAVKESVQESRLFSRPSSTNVLWLATLSRSGRLRHDFYAQRLSMLIDQLSKASS